MEDIGHIQLEEISGLDDDKDKESVRIVQFTDLHQWPSDATKWETRGRSIDFEKEGYSQKKNIDLMEHCLDSQKPNLVIFTGDIIDGRACTNLPDNTFLDVMKEILEPLDKRGIKWTFIPGNHEDDSSPWTREQLLELYKLPNCVSANAKTFNHTLTVGTTSEPSPESSVRLWLFDSGTNDPDPSIMFTTFSPEAVAGFKELTKSGTLGCSSIELAYFHIPLPEYNGLEPLVGKNRLFDAALHGGKVPFPFNYQPFTQLVRLLGRDKVAASSKLNSGLYDAFVEYGNVLATFCGHDHHSDFVGFKDGIFLCYGRCGSHTPPSDWEGTGGPLPFARGARLVNVDAKGKTTTWITSFEKDQEDFYELVEDA